MCSVSWLKSAAFSRVKRIVHLLLLAFLPCLSGCLSMQAIQSADRRDVATYYYTAADKIEKAALTADDRLCVFFEKDSTNSTPSRVNLVIPRSHIRTKIQHQVDYGTSGILLVTNHDDMFLRLSRDKTNPAFVRCSILRGTCHTPGLAIQKNWPLLDDQRANLKFIPVGQSVQLGPNESAESHGLSLTLLSNATETVYLTRSSPIEFAYIDTSIKRTMTVVMVDPLTKTTKHAARPQYYALLPLTVPLDVATFPFQALAIGFFIWAYSSSGHC